MKKLVFWAAVCGLMFGSALFAEPGEEPKEGGDAEPVSFELFGYPYFVRNTVDPPEGESSLAVRIGSLKRFNEIFGVGMVMGPRPEMVDDGYFETHEIASFIEWGAVPWEYAVRSAVKKEKELIVKVSKSGEPIPSALFASPLILGFDRETLAGIEKISFVFMPKDASADETGEVFSTGR